MSVGLCRWCKSFIFSDVCPICRWVRPPKMSYITLKIYLMGHDSDPVYAGEYNSTLRSNAIDLLERTRKLATRLLELGVIQYTPELRSGWRPKAYNAKIGGALHSNHIICKAIDWSDNDQIISKYLEANQQLLVEFDLAMESPKATPSWCHLQSCLPASGRRVFLP